MVNNNQSLTIKMVPDSIRDIELFVEKICDQLFINDTYYGNILISLNCLFNFLQNNDNNNKIDITYNSDYKNINISFQNIDTQSVKLISTKLGNDEIIDNEEFKDIYLIQSLVDNISESNNRELIFSFDISALHNHIYKHRSGLLKKYFQKQRIAEKVNNHDD